MKNSIIAVVVALVIGVGGFLAWKYFFTSKTISTVTSATEQTQQQVKNTFASTTMAIAISYPMGYNADPSFVDTAFGPKKPIHGVKFTIPQSMATGTNLSPDSGVIVEQLPRAKKCTGDIFVYDNVKATTVTENGVTYSVASTSGAGAGNFYQETIFAISGSSPCTAVRYFIHTTNVGNYPEGTVKEFDQSALLSSFDEIRSSLTLTMNQALPTSTSTQP